MILVTTAKQDLSSGPREKRDPMLGSFFAFQGLTRKRATKL